MADHLVVLRFSAARRDFLLEEIFGGGRPDVGAHSRTGFRKLGHHPKLPRK